MSFLAWFVAGVLGTPPTGPVPVVNGTPAQQCEWPASVALTVGGTVYCSGTLISPDVVLTAAHCIHPDSGWGVPDAIAFGEDGFAPVMTTGVQSCGIHPFYVSEAELHSDEDAYDLAYCVLSEPVDIRPTPMIMGCEVDQLVPGMDVTIVSFGANSYEFDMPDGIGLKRWSVQTLEEIDDLDQIFVLGGEGSGCSGDSGGSAYVQLADGSWRVIGATARVHPDAPDEPPFCLYGTVYTGAWNEMYWYEAETGLDLTPCYDTDGNYDPSPACQDFPEDPRAAAEWTDGCASQPGTVAYEECPDPVDPDTGDTGDETAGVDDTGTTTGAGETTGGDESTSSTGAPSETGDGQDTSSSDESGGQALDADEGGCSCRSQGGHHGILWLSFLVLGWSRKPRRRGTLDARLS